MLEYLKKMKEKRFTLFWKKLLIMDLGLIVILVRIFGMIYNYLTKKSSNDSIFPQHTENGYPFFDSINCDINNILQILETDILLIDEVLSVGDAHFKEKSYNKMKELIKDDKRTVIIVSHSLNSLKELCDEVIWLNDGKIKEIGKPDYIINKYLEYMKQGA